MGLVRLILALSVCIFHSNEGWRLTLVGGFPAVTFFFVISGFYMAMVLNEKYTSYRQFIVARLLKIFPLYWIVLLFCVTCTQIHFFEYGLWSGIYFIFSNIFIVGSQFTSILYHDADQVRFLSLGQGYRPEVLWNMLYVGPIWSLSIELLFYFLAPLCVKGRYVWARLSLLGGVSLLSYGFLTFMNSWIIPWNYNFFLPCAYTFAAGATSYFFYKKLRPYISNKQPLNYALGLLLISYLFAFQFLPSTFIIKPIKASLNIETLGVILFAGLMPFVFQATAALSFDRWLGNLSYPIYISHSLFLHYFHHLAGLDPIVATILMAVFLELTAAKIIEKYRSRYTVSTHAPLDEKKTAPIRLVVE